jgi:glycosyltransferase involved in cell wall biosynthesis
VPEIVEHGRTGWLVENNVSSIATALVTLATGNKACELAAAGREQAHTRFSIDRMVDETLAVYREVARA